MKVAWFKNKLLQDCACGSGQPYRSCCVRREMAFAAIVLVAAVALFAGVSGLSRRTFALTVCGVLAGAGLAGWWIQRRLK